MKKVQVPNATTFAIVATERALHEITVSRKVQSAVLDVLAEKYHAQEHLDRKSLSTHVERQSERHGYAWFHFDYASNDVDDNFQHPCVRKVLVNVELVSGYHIKVLWTISRQAQQARYHEATGEVTTDSFGFRDDPSFVFIVKAVEDRSVKISSIKLVDALGEASGAELLS